MRGYKTTSAFTAAAICIFIAGCSHIPLKDGELVVGGNTTATIDNLGVARVKNHF